MDQIQVGIPYLVIGLTTDFQEDSNYDYFNKYIHNIKNWYIQLKVNDETRCFAIVYVKNDTLSFVGGGGSEFAKRVNECEKKYSFQERNNRYFIREKLYGDCDFIMVDSESDFFIYPIGDSIYFYCTEAFKVHDSFEDFFYSFR